MNVTLALSSLCLVVGGLLIYAHVLSQRRPSLAVRLARARSEQPPEAPNPLAASAPACSMRPGCTKRAAAKQQSS
jgi:hypothetical protein